MLRVDLRRTKTQTIMPTNPDCSVSVTNTEKAATPRKLNLNPNVFNQDTLLSVHFNE